MSEETDLTAIEAVLKGLCPSSARLDRDQVMFKAGQASLRREQRAWQALSVLCAGVALLAAFMPSTQMPTGDSQVSYPPLGPVAEVKPPANLFPSENQIAYLKMRNEMVEQDGGMFVIEAPRTIHDVPLLDDMDIPSDILGPSLRRLNAPYSEGDPS